MSFLVALSWTKHWLFDVLVVIYLLLILLTYLFIRSFSRLDIFLRQRERLRGRLWRKPNKTMNDIGSSKCCIPVEEEKPTLIYKI